MQIKKFDKRSSLLYESLNNARRVYLIDPGLNYPKRLDCPYDLGVPRWL